MQVDTVLDARLRLTDRSGRSSEYHIDCRGWILGSAPGCDLRLDQSAPPVWVLLVPCPGGVLVRKLAPLVRVEVNGELWQSGIVPYPALVRLGDLTLELSGGIEGAAQGPLQPAAPEDRPERWFRKARHLLRLMRGLVSGGESSPSQPAHDEHAAPSMSPALETAWQMLRVAQEQHRDDLVRLERERALVASRWAEIERDRVERETARLQHHQRLIDLEERDNAVTVREAAVARSEQELFQSHLSHQHDLLALRQQRLELESALVDLETRSLALAAREKSLENRDARRIDVDVAAVVPEEPVVVVEEVKPEPSVAPVLAEAQELHPPIDAEPTVPRSVSIPAIPESWWPAQEPVAVVPEPAAIEPIDPIMPSVEPVVSEVSSELDSLLHDSETGNVRHLPEWFQEWCRAGFRTAAQARVAQSVGPALWEVTGRIHDSDAALSRVLLNEGLTASTDLERLLAAARQERRPLRSILLGDGVLTKYQLAQLENENLGGLVLGPLAVLDRLPSGPREDLFSVYDPRRGAEGVLHHLAESEMSDAARPDEYGQRALAAAAIESENLQATWEVLEIDGRPAVLRESPSGCGSDGWSALAAVPGVWYRLVLQATLGLRDLHASGLTHGRLDASHVLLTPNGLVKLLDPAVPSWIFGPQVDDDPSADLRALARLARSWLSDENRSGPSPKPLPPLLLAILDRLESQSGPPIATAVELASELDQAGTQVPGNAAAWQRFLAEIRRDTGTTPASFSA